MNQSATTGWATTAEWIKRLLKSSKVQAVAKIFLGNLRTVAKKIDKAKEVQCVVSCLMMLEPKLLPGFTSYCLQDEPKCHGSLSRSSNNGVSLLLLWQVLHFLVNIEKQKHRRLQCLAFCGFLLKTQKPTTLWKKFVPFWEYITLCIKWFCLPMFMPRLWRRRAKTKNGTHESIILTLGGKST